MSIRVPSQFLSLLESARIEKPSDVEKYEELSISTSLGFDERGTVVDEQKFSLWLFSDGSAPNGETLLKFIGNALAKSGHKSDRTIAFIAAYTCCYLAGGRSIREVDLDRLFSFISDGDLNQYCVFRYSFPDEWQFAMPPFQFGRLNSEKLAYQSKKAGSDYWERYSTQLAGKFSISRPHIRVRVLDFDSLFGKLVTAPRPDFLFYELIDHYFQTLARAHFEDFWTMFADVQEILVALGAPYINAPRSQLLLGQQISIFLNFSATKHGWVAPLERQPTLEWSNAHVRIPNVLDRLANEFHFTKFDNSEIHNVLRQYVRFISRAKRYLIEDQTDNAFLHFIIALDLLFGEKQQSTVRVTKRVAVLVHRTFQVSYEEQEVRLRKLYDLRSRYVHQGNSVSPESVTEVQDVCTSVLECLLRFHAREKDHSFLQWQKDIDFLASALEAGRAENLAIMQELGIAL